MRRPHLATVFAFVMAVLVAFWTKFTLSTDHFAGLDALTTGDGLDIHTPWGQIMAAWSFVTHPVVVYAVVAGLAWWAHRRKLRNLAVALALSIPFGWVGSWLVKIALHRPRPATAADLITSSGYSYPSGHVVAATTLLVMAWTIAGVTRRPRLVQWTIRLSGIAFVLTVAYNRWVLHTHWMTDVIGGVLVGGLSSAVALSVARVRMTHIPLWTPVDRLSRVAVIVNPTKISDWEVFRRHVEGALAESGVDQPLWLETHADDPGRRATRTALKHQVELVLVAGGDGTVRTVCGCLADKGVPLGVLPAGTGNLLARNLGIPLDLDQALDVAIEGRTTAIDLVELKADDGRPQPSVVMAGMGVDAVIMSQTNPELKKAVGTAAYVTAAMGAVTRPPFEVTVALDHNEPFTRQAGLALVANVGQLMAGITMVPEASPSDGLLDVLIASPERPTDWASMATRVIGGLPDADGIDRGQATTVTFTTATPIAYQIDGDTEGECRELNAQLRPSSVLVRTPW